MLTFEERVYNIELKSNDTDDSIIEYIKNNRKEIQHISVQKIAKDLYISPNSIIRTSKKLGYSGFSELKFSIQNEDNPSEITTVENRVFEKLPQSIIRSIDVLDETALDRLTDQMVDANKILIAGVGDSVYFCEYFGRYLRCLGKKTEYFAQIHDIEYFSNFYEEGDLVIIVSVTGESERLVKLAANLKKRCENLNVTCVTHFGENPLSILCDDQVCFWGDRRIVNGYNVTDRAGLLMLIKMICEMYLKKI